MSNELVKRYLWWLCLVVAPIILIGIELFHPAGFTHDPGMYQYLSVPEQHTHAHKALDYFGPEWWFTLHMIQTPLVGLVAIGLWLIVAVVNRQHGTAAVTTGWLSRLATFVFVIYYTALDSIGGIGLGRSIEITQTLAAAGTISQDQVNGVATVLNATWVDPWVGGVGSFISETGSYAILFAAVLAAISLYLAKKAPWPALVILVAFGWELQVSHASFHGPIAFGLLAIFAIYMRLSAPKDATQ